MIFFCLGEMCLHRIYYYDAQPLEGITTAPLGGGALNFGATEVAKRNKRIHADLMKRPFFALRFGELCHEGWNLDHKILAKPESPVEVTSSDVRPSIRQKGGDRRIGLDIASLTLKCQAQVIVRVTADSDFIPAMKFARREGAQLFLITLAHGIKEGMREHAERAIDDLP